MKAGKKLSESVWIYYGLFEFYLPRMPFMAAPNDSGSNPIWFESCEMSEALDMEDTFLDDGGGAK